MTVVIQEVNPHVAKELILTSRAFDINQLINLNNCIFMAHSAWAGYVDGELLCVWALCPPTMLDNTAYLWLYTMDGLKGHEFVLVRHSQLVMKKMLEKYECIVGLTDTTDRKAIRWLEWLGANFSSPNNGYRRFVIAREQHG